MAEDMLRKVEIDWLLGIYGALLTDHQRRIAQLYCEEDYSLGEIASQLDISRQSVHETLVRVEKQLKELDDLLLLRKKFSDAEMLLKEADASLNGNVDIPKARALISSVIRLLLDEEGNDGL